MKRERIQKICFAVVSAATLFGASPLLASVDCSEAYNGQEATCEQIECSEKFKTFLGTWTGPMESYDRERNTFRPYTNTVTYDSTNCLNNSANGETFIIGRKTDVYPAVTDANGAVVKPAETKTGLLITGKDAIGRKFLRTIDAENGMINYEHVFTDEASETAIWRYNWAGDATNPPMVFTVIDGRDLTEQTAHKRLVTVSLSGPGWSAIGGRGYHTLTPQ